WSSVQGSAAGLVLAGQATVQAGIDDGINAIEFSNDPTLDFEGAITQTFLLTDNDGTVLEADILVNDRRFSFNTDAGNVGLDLETIMLHELGHLLGLDHSPVGTTSGSFGQQTVDEDSAVMFPLMRGPTEVARQLTEDDQAAIAGLYPSGGVRGAISGRVTLDGSGVFGAHVLVFDPLRQVLTGAVTLPDGSYRLGGLPPGRYVVRVQPLNGIAGPSSLGGIFSQNTALVNTTFFSTFLDRVIEIRAGTEVDGVNLEVR
ncbi:MAG: carboxypeptidase-like regulatory domain-containing protein, partial [Acidobacteriota bacterium]